MSSVTNAEFQRLLANDRSNPHVQIVPEMVCADGFKMSVQAGRTHYCSPRVDGEAEYDAFEVGYPSAVEPLLMEYAEDPKRPTDTVYGYVPADVIDNVIQAHGGLVMKVYAVVYLVQVGEESLEKIFAKREAAENWAKNHDDPCNYVVQEWTLG